MVIPTLDALRKELHTKVNDLRSIYGIVNDEAFATTWGAFSDDQKLMFVNMIALFNKTAVTNMIETTKSKELALMSVVQLRQLAKRRGLVAYMQMCKSTLLSELSKLEGLNYDKE